MSAVLVEDDHFAVLDIPGIFRTDDVEGAGFRSKDRTSVKHADHEGTNAEGIAGTNEFVVGEPYERIGAFELAQPLDKAIDETIAPGARHQMQYDFRIGCRLHNGAFAYKLAAKSKAIGEVAIVADGEATALEFGE